MSAKRTSLIGVTLISVSLVGAALWKNVNKRQAVRSNAVLAAQKYPDYAPALIRANDITLGNYATDEKRLEIVEGTFVFSDTVGNLIKTRSEKALAHTPLQVKALTQIAMADYLKSLNWSDHELLLLVKSRNARDRQTLVALSTIKIRAGNFDELLDLYDLRYRLGNLAETDLEVIKALSTLPEQRRLIELKLAAAPSWGEDYFRSAIPTWDTQNLQDNRSSLFTFLAAQDDNFVRQTLLRFYFLQLRRLALYDLALEDWAALPEVAASGQKTQPVYNTDFQALAAPQPFNWRTYEQDLALAEIERSGGLYASSSSPKRALIAQQLVTAPTGQALRFEMDGSWQYRQQQGHFFWRVSCMPGRAPFYDITVGDSAKKSGSLSFDIAPLPESCKFQDLQLYAEPGGFNQRVSLGVAKVDIVPRGLTEVERQSQDISASEDTP